MKASRSTRRSTLRSNRPLLALPFLLLQGGLLFAQGERPGAPDAFHPDVVPGATPATPAYGGRIIVHLESMPARLNRIVDNSSVLRSMLYAFGETLLHQDWQTYELRPRLCTGYTVEDQLLLRPEAAARYGAAVRRVGTGADERWILFGAIEQGAEGATVRPRADGAGKAGAIEVAAGDVLALERGTVFTFDLRPGVTFHDGHPFDAGDVRFTWECFQNPEVDCDETRSMYSKMIGAEVLGDLSIRIFYRSQYYAALEEIGEMTLLPRHVYDPRDPDHPKHDPDATPSEIAKSVNENEANHLWIGLGPYRVVEANRQYVEAVRYDGYWDQDDPEYGGYLDVIRWRSIDSDNTAFQALLNGEVDLMMRVTSEDYFGEATEAPEFTRGNYKGYVYTGNYGYTAWNLKRPWFQDLRVRRALAHAFDMQAHLESTYRGLGRIATGPPNIMGPAYDGSVQPLAYDPDLAEELLSEAGWYDRDGDGILDKDGVAFRFTFLYPTGNEPSKTFGLKYQEAVAALGIKMDIENIEWATFLERINGRDFDTVNLGWQPDIESDPEQLWHSKWAVEGLRSSNFVSYADAETDRLIEAIQRELDFEARMELWHAFHRRVADQQPYLFMIAAPRKFGLAKRFRGFQTSAIAPGYSIREIYLRAGTPGTRPTVLGD